METSLLHLTGDFSIINEPYVRAFLRLTKHIITHLSGSARGLNGLFVLSVSTLSAVVTSALTEGLTGIRRRVDEL